METTIKSAGLLKKSGRKTSSEVELMETIDFVEKQK